MELIPTTLAGVLLIQPKVIKDERGFFIETYQQARYEALGIRETFVQDNQSASQKGTLRGLHAQVAHPQAKLVRCIEGEIFDVAVDVRRGSPNFGKWFGAMLSAENARQMYVPTGFVHGFAVRSERAQVEYKCSDVYHADDQLTVLWSDPELAIDWGIVHPILSAKDSAAKTLAECASLLPKF